MVLELRRSIFESDSLPERQCIKYKRLTFLESPPDVLYAHRPPDVDRRIILLPSIVQVQHRSCKREPDSIFDRNELMKK